MFSLTHRVKKTIVAMTVGPEDAQRSMNAASGEHAREASGQRVQGSRKRKREGAEKGVGGGKRATIRQREAAADAEINRLKQELAMLKAGGCRPQEREKCYPIHPRRALTLAGFWNVLPNDLLGATPALIAAVEARGGTVLRRDGLQTCFAGKEKRLVIEAVLEVMASRLPQYQRRVEGE
jgi:hypothetical protein